MKLIDFMLAKCLVNLLGSKQMLTILADTADEIDKLIDEKFTTESENVQRAIVVDVLLPLCAQLMHENPSKLVGELESFRTEIAKAAVEMED